MGKEQTELIKGICALMILLHHIELETGGILFLRAGPIGVAGFLMLSGYGLMKSLLKDNDYSRKIIKKKIPRLVCNSLLSIAYMALFWWIVGEPATTTEWLTVFMGNRLLTWFFPAIILRYFFFYISTRIGRSNPKKSVQNERAVFRWFGRRAFDSA